VNNGAISQALNRRVLVPVANPVGGIRTYMIYNLKCIHDAGFRLTFFSPKGDALDQFKRDIAGWDGTEFIEAPSHSLYLLLQSLRHVLRSKTFSLIHSQGLQIGTITAAADFFRRIPHLITLHDVIIPGQNDFGKWGWLKQKAAAFVTRRASCIIPVSRDCEENHYAYFPSWKQGPVQVKPILNGIDVNRIQQTRSVFASDRQPNLRKLLGIGNEIVLGGFFGRFMPQKGFDIVLQALAILAEQGYSSRFHLMATVDNTGYRSETLQAAAANPKVAAMVHFLDAVPNITPFLLQTDAVIMPSRWEACPLLPMEAMAAGTPVIGSDCIGLREVLRETPSLVFPAGNAEELAKKIVVLIENTPAIKATAEQFAATAAERFDVKTAAGQLLDIYKSVLI
jgi:glycosyltransferase involved in cell wall biosynthesis